MTDLLVVDNVIASAQSKLARAEKDFGKIHPKVIKALANLADLYFVLKENRLAEPLYFRILEIQQWLYGPTHPDNALTLLSLGELYESESSLRQAEKFYQTALWVLDHGDNTHTDVMGRIFLKLYGIYKLTGNQKKISEVESCLYAYLKQDYKTSKVPLLEVLPERELAAAA